MTDEEAVEETPAVDDMREQLLNELSQNLGDILIESHLRPHEDVWLRVKIDAWQDAAMISKNSGFEYLASYPQSTGISRPKEDTKTRNLTPV